MTDRERFKSYVMLSIDLYTKNKEGLELKKQMQDIAIDIVDQIFDDFDDRKLKTKDKNEIYNK